MPLLYTVVQSKDLILSQEIEISVKEFNLYAKPMEDREYPEENIEEIAEEISMKKTLQGKIEVLKNYFEGLSLDKNISLALSEESPFTAQLLSELKSINKNKLVKLNSLLYQFLLNEKISNHISSTNERFIQITPLNRGQKKAVKQSLSVITGPPGTGKTQVILNILANAVLKNKKVLVASKNNQAVDNVKEKLNSIIRESNFFMKFGSRRYVEENVVPMIQSFVSKIHHGNYDKIYDEIQNKLDDKYYKLVNYAKEISKNEELKINIQELKQKIVQQNQKIEIIKRNFDHFIEKTKNY